MCFLFLLCCCLFFFFQAEDGIRYLVRSRGLGDVYKRQGMAQATITLDNSDGWLPIDYTEVEIARRSFRSGENEYLINGQQIGHIFQPVSYTHLTLPTSDLV